MQKIISETYVAIVNVLFISINLCRKKIAPSTNVAYILIESTKTGFLNHYNIILNVIVDICRIVYHHCLHFFIRVTHHCSIRVTQGLYNAKNNIREFLPIR
jgi:hypothetical protein